MHEHTHTQVVQTHGTQALYILRQPTWSQRATEFVNLQYGRCIAPLWGAWTRSSYGCDRKHVLLSEPSPSLSVNGTSLGIEKMSFKYGPWKSRGTTASSHKLPNLPCVHGVLRMPQKCICQRTCVRDNQTLEKYHLHSLSCPLLTIYWASTSLSICVTHRTAVLQGLRPSWHDARPPEVHSQPGEKDRQGGWGAQWRDASPRADGEETTPGRLPRGHGWLCLLKGRDETGEGSNSRFKREKAARK